MTEALAALLLALIAYEAKAWLPRALDALIRMAAKRLPKRQQARFREEWRAHVHDTPGAAMKLWHAIGFIVASGRMFPRWRHAVLKRRAYVRGRSITRSVTRMLDLAIALPALVLFFPLFVGISLVSGFSGPMFFRERRMGQGGRHIYIIKFRTMSLSQLGRMTPLGQFLRHTSLDELPQLFNVVRGDLSLVGPRPHRDVVPDEMPGLVGRHVFGSRAPLAATDHRLTYAVRSYFSALALCVYQVLCLGGDRRGSEMLSRDKRNMRGNDIDPK